MSIPPFQRRYGRQRGVYSIGRLVPANDRVSKGLECGL